MHDCREVERKLIDLVFDELGTNERSRLISEVGQCPDCLAEYESVSGTMRIFDQAVEASLPDESFWPRHGEGLRRRLEREASRPGVSCEPFWKRLFSIRLHVPVPVAALLVLVILALSLLALRRPQAAPAQIVFAPSSPAPRQSALPVEAPLVQERVITRTVYVEKKRARGKGDDLQPPSGARPAQSQMVARGSNEENRNGLFTHAGLTDYQPPDDMRIRIIRRSNSDEK
ncbi:MAG TPA: hypothetical protein VEV81_05590 [Pyrinomonadaceae bacterium]|nr:hypothetical protein [Pyrinomonadaceae bacterium]